MDDSCAVCAENLEWIAYGSCNHREVCSTCVIRLRFIFTDLRCCICKTECPIVFVTKDFGDFTNTITDFSILPSEPKEGRVGALSLWYHEETKAFFDDVNQYNKIKSMCRLSCSTCAKRFKSVEHLKDHLSHQHNLHMCSLCLVGRKVFVSEQKVFSKGQLIRHISSGDSEVDGSESERGGFTGHPMCQFCKTPFYGSNELYSHMSREHFTCHICQRLKPGQYEYYGNYDDLEVHFRADHFLCEDESCLAKKFIVFEMESEMKRHNSIDHGGRMARSQHSGFLQIEAGFQYQNSRRGRGRSFRRETNLSFLEPQASYAINDSQPLLQPIMEESSFPPLSVQANRSQTRRVGQNSESLLSNNMTTHLRNQTNRRSTIGSTQAWPALTRAPPQASMRSSSASTQPRHHARAEITRTLASPTPQDTSRNGHSALSGSSSGGNTTKNHHSSSTSIRSMEQPSHSHSPQVSAVQSDNKSLVEKIRAILNHDEELFKAFKDTSGKYRRGSIDARIYLEYVRGYGLSDLVLDMAKLCPDPERQKELIDTHNDSAVKTVKGKGVKVESSSEDRSDKGKSKVDSSSSGGGKQQCKKTSKFHRARLGEKSMAAVLDLRSSNAGSEPEAKNNSFRSSQNQNPSSTGGLPLGGAWRRGSAELFS